MAQTDRGGYREPPELAEKWREKSEDFLFSSTVHLRLCLLAWCGHTLTKAAPLIRTGNLNVSGPDQYWAE